MNKTFFFIDGIQPDRASKRRMRRHVMKGKNAGKTFHRPSRLGRANHQPNTTVVPPPLPVSRQPNKQRHYTDWICVSSNTIRSCGNALLTFSLPVAVSPYSLKIINEFFAFTADRIYPARLGLSVDDAKSMWLRVLFSDEATYHCNIALMEASNEIFMDNGASSPKALYRLSQTLAIVKRRLESADALSDSTIGIVVSLISQEQCRKEFLGAKAHIDGLRRMVELRGGLSQLEGNIALLLKVCKTDIIFSLQHGGPTMFFRNRMPEVQVLLAPKGLSFDRPSAASSVQHKGLNPQLHEILLDVLGSSSLFNNRVRVHAVDLLTYQEMLVSICYRLIRFHPLDEPRLESDVEAIYHTGLTIFMMTIFLQYDRRRIMDHELASFCFRDTLDRTSLERDNELVLWYMIIGGIWISGEVDGDWLAPRIWMVAENLGIKSWDEVRKCVGKFPWVNVLHDEPGRVLWDHVAQFAEAEKQLVFE
ncbi:hypothetical protein AUP68_15523 [Ilyonectria robusta]